MKKITCIFLVICMLFCFLAMTGCSNSDTAALRELESSQNYEWEELFHANGKDGEVLTISRRHANYIIIHNTKFKITIYKDGECTYFYEAYATPCKNGFLPCFNKYADLKDACAMDSVIAALYPHVETVIANRVIEDVLQKCYKEDMTRILFTNLVDTYVISDFNADVISNTVTSGIGIGANFADEYFKKTYISKAVEIALGVDEAKAHWDETHGVKDAKDYAKLIMPWLSEIEKGKQISLDVISFPLAKANEFLNSLSKRYELGKLNMTNYSAQFAEVEQEVIDNFKGAMDHIDEQKRAEQEKKAQEFQEWWDDFIGF